MRVAGLSRFESSHVLLFLLAGSVAGSRRQGSCILIDLYEARIDTVNSIIGASEIDPPRLTRRAWIFSTNRPGDGGHPEMFPVVIPF